MQFATNDLGHFAVALGLRDAPAAAADARIVSLSSFGHRRQRAVRRRGDTPLEWRRHLRQAVHPGTIATTNLNGYMGPDVLADLRASAPYAEAFDADAPNTTSSGVAAYALDPAKRKPAAWEASLGLLGLSNKHEFGKQADPTASP
jgi:hypothetical protein